MPIKHHIQPGETYAFYQILAEAEHIGKRRAFLTHCNICGDERPTSVFAILRAVNGEAKNCANCRKKARIDKPRGIVKPKSLTRGIVKPKSLTHGCLNDVQRLGMTGRWSNP